MGNYVPYVSASGGDAAYTLVNERFANSQVFSTDAYNRAVEFLNSLLVVIGYLDEPGDAPQLTKPSFDVDLTVPSAPSAPTIDYGELDRKEPRNVFQFSEEKYVDELLSKLRSKISTLLDGSGSGLGAEAEDAMFDREQERDALALQETKERIANDWSKRNLPAPGGALFSQMLSVDTEYLNKQMDKTRDITVETRKIEIENMRIAMQEARGILSALINYHSQYWDRRLQAAKAILEEALAIFNAVIEKIKTKATVYGTEVSAYAAKAGALVAVANAKIAAFRGEVEYLVANSNIIIENLKKELEYNKAVATIAAEVTKAGANVSAQLAASALSGVSAGAHINASASKSTGYDARLTESHSYDETK